MNEAVTTGYLWLRKTPNGEKVKVYPPSTVVEVTGGTIQLGNWHWTPVTTFDSPSVSGYMAQEFLRSSNPIGEYLTADNDINVRIAPGISSRIVKVLPNNAPVQVYDGRINQDGHWWVPTDLGWIAFEFLTPVKPPTIPGFHILNGGDKEIYIITDMATAGKKFFSTVVNDWTLANDLLDYKLPVVFRYTTGNTPSPTQWPGWGNSAAEAYSNGYIYAQKLLQRDEYAYLARSKNLYLQFYNEEVWHEFDGYFNMGMGQCALDHGRKAILFNDASGNPYDDASGKWLDKWVKRIPAMQWAYKNNVPIGGHYYSNPAYPTESLSSYNAQYFANRMAEFYAIMPSNGQPDLWVTECGTYAAVPPSDKSVADDIGALVKIWERYPFVRGFAYWTIRCNGTNWTKSDYISQLPEIFSKSI
jgi:hypothetical protein